MKIEVDTHTHTVASGHAYSTVYELAMGARKRRLKGFVLTDHGPALPGGTHPYHFSNMRILPERIRGVRFSRGVEANILDLEGTLDLGDDYLVQLHFAYAGLQAHGSWVLQVAAGGQNGSTAHRNRPFWENGKVEHAQCATRMGLEPDRSGIAWRPEAP